MLTSVLRWLKEMWDLISTNKYCRTVLWGLLFMLGPYVLLVGLFAVKPYVLNDEISRRLDRLVDRAFSKHISEDWLDGAIAPDAVNRYAKFRFELNDCPPNSHQLPRKGYFDFVTITAVPGAFCGYAQYEMTSSTPIRATPLGGTILLARHKREVVPQHQDGIFAKLSEELITLFLCAHKSRFAHYSLIALMEELGALKSWDMLGATGVKSVKNESSPSEYFYSRYQKLQRTWPPIAAYRSD